MNNFPGNMSEKRKQKLPMPPDDEPPSQDDVQQPLQSKSPSVINKDDVLNFRGLSLNPRACNMNEDSNPTNSLLGRRPSRLFSPFAAVTKFCWTFIDRNHRKQIASAFFDNGKIYLRGWDLYSVWNDACPTAKPIILVPERQLLALLNEINLEFSRANVTVTNEMREAGLALSFDEYPDLWQPDFLGRSTSRAEHDQLLSAITFSDPGILVDTEKSDLQSYKAKLRAAANVCKEFPKPRTPMWERPDIKRQLPRAQRLLGLIPEFEKSVESMRDDLSRNIIPPGELALPQFEHDAIIIALDVEANERRSRQITEVGIATLDTRDLYGEPHGPLGQDWHYKIRARHFRVREYLHHVNHEFVRGCPDKFDFGRSEIVAEHSLPEMVESCFRFPWSHPRLTEDDLDVVPEERNIVLLGHAVSGDIRYIRSIGVDLTQRRNIIDIIDTTAMYNVHAQTPNAASLGSILNSFDIIGWNLHNAGNDAVYTVQAMLAMAV